MKAGRELDALVAKKIMGWKKGELNWTIDELWIDSKGSYKCVGKFSPSSNIADAWKVVEKVQESRFNFELTRRTDGKCFATFKKVGSISDDLYEVWDKAETAPLAICLAALRCKGIDIDGNN